MNYIFVDILKKELEKTIINELCKSDVINFSQCNTILKKLDKDIIKLESKLENKENLLNVIVKVLV